MLGFGQCECSEFLQSSHGRQPALLLVLGTEHPDGPHRQPCLNCLEGAEAPVAAVELHVDQPGGDGTHRRASVADDAVADDVEFAQLLDELPWELCPLPVTVDDGQDFGVHEVSGALQIASLVIGQLVAQPEVVGAQRPADLGRSQ